MRLKSMVLLVAFLLLPTLLLAEILTVSFSGAEMRSAPNVMNSRIIAKLSLDTPLQVLEKGRDYYKVKDYRGRTGWVHRSLLGATTGVMITGVRVNVRQGPSLGHSVIFQLTQGETCRLLSNHEGWLEIQTGDDRKGWVAEFLTWGQQLQ